MSSIQKNAGVSNSNSQIEIENLGQNQKTGNLKGYMAKIGKGFAKAKDALSNFFNNTIPNTFKGLSNRKAAATPPREDGRLNKKDLKHFKENAAFLKNAQNERQMNLSKMDEDDMDLILQGGDEALNKNIEEGFSKHEQQVKLKEQQKAMDLQRKERLLEKENQRLDSIKLGAPPLTRHDELLTIKDTLIRNALDAFRQVPDLSMNPSASPTRQNTVTSESTEEQSKLTLGELTPRDKLPDRDNLGNRVFSPEGELQVRSPGSFVVEVNLPRMLWSSMPVLSGSKLVALFNIKDIPAAIGESTFKNSMGSKTVSDNSKEERLQAALNIRKNLEANLTGEEMFALKERIGVMKELAQINLAKCGPTSSEDANKSTAQQLRTWQKSVCVGGISYLGLSNLDPMKLLGGSSKDSITKANDLTVALVMHYDVIFADRDEHSMSPMNNKVDQDIDLEDDDDDIEVDDTLHDVPEEFTSGQGFKEKPVTSVKSNEGIADENGIIDEGIVIENTELDNLNQRGKGFVENLNQN